MIMNLIPQEGQTLQQWYASLSSEDQHTWLPTQSLKVRLALLPCAEQERWLNSCDEQTRLEMARDEWWYVARPKQIPPPGRWMIYLALAGRGFGKSKAGSEWIVERALGIPYDLSGFPTEHLVIAETLSDAQIVCAEGPAGILRVLERRGLKRDEHYTYVRSPKPRITILETGVKIFFEGADGADVGRGYNLASLWSDEICIAKNEPVVTERGPVPIQDVAVGDRVWTRSGWKPVKHAWMTAHLAEIVQVVTDCGSVRLTANHRVWTQRGWVEAGSLAIGDTLSSCNLSSQTLPHSTNGTGQLGTSISEPDTTTTEMDSCCTEPCGSVPTGRSLMATKSTTSTGSDGTTGSIISKCSPPPIIESSALSSATIEKSSLTALSDAPMDSSACGKSASRERASASSVAWNSSAPACGPRYAQIPAGRNSSASLRPVAVISVVPDGKADVYDLEVEGEPEFFAGSGSLLVHNCKWKNPYEAWYEGILPSLRSDLKDDHPRAFVTTTPKPIALLKEWLATTDGTVVTVRGSTFENILNLSVQVIRQLFKKYEGTSLGRQELFGEMLDKGDGILFTYEAIERHRRSLTSSEVQAFAHTVVGVDPGLTGDDDGDETGIVVVGKARDEHLYVLEDASQRVSGRDAAIHAWKVFIRNSADVLVYENNLGKAWMQQVFEDAYKELQKQGLFPQHTTAPIRGVFSTIGKKLRAEPVAMRYEQGKVHHTDRFEVLESQMLTYDPLAPGAKHNSPDRLDALVHACRHLMETEKQAARIISSIHQPLGYNWDPYQ